LLDQRQRQLRLLVVSGDGGGLVGLRAAAGVVLAAQLEELQLELGLV